MTYKQARNKQWNAMISKHQHEAHVTLVQVKRNTHTGKVWHSYR